MHAKPNINPLQSKIVKLSGEKASPVFLEYL